MSSGVLISFAGAVQASISVLLTIFSGVVAAQFGLLSTGAAEEVSKLCVKLLLPCLLISNLGSELQLDTVVRYVPIIIWAAVYTLLSIAIGRIVAAAFGLPRWFVSVTAFNNTESLPLLLLQSLSTTGVLASLVGAGDESDGINRARSYFLACSVVTNTITFGRGPEILTSSNHDSAVVRAFQWTIGGFGPDDHEEGGDDCEDPEDQRGQVDGHENPRGRGSRRDEDDHDSESEDGNSNNPDEETSLLPKKIRRSGAKVRDSLLPRLEWLYQAFPAPMQKVLNEIGVFVNPPFIGALIGVVIGVSPPLHRLFFADMADGGYANAWLAKALQNIGELFVALQVVVVGVKLSLSLRLWKEGEDEEAGTVPLGTIVCAVFIRFILWPAISIPLIWALASRTGLLTDDPILWWTMMMMPVGPPAMKNLALADVSGTDQRTRMSIAKFLTLSYMITPLISFAVVGALAAAEAAKSR
ncbi:auxin efflux carrier [Nemania serpens]|nr:auxin efflux carrier [Nemania serpens]